MYCDEVVIKILQDIGIIKHRLTFEMNQNVVTNNKFERKNSMKSSLGKHTKIIQGEINC